MNPVSACWQHGVLCLCIVSIAFPGLELCVLWSARERYHVANVLHTGHEEHQTLEAQTKSAVGTGAEAAGVQIPPHILHGYVAAFYLAHQLVVVLLAHRTAYDFSNLREQYVGALNGLSVFVYLHVEGLYVLRVVGHNNRFLEVMLHKIALVLACEVHAP